MKKGLLFILGTILIGNMAYACGGLNVPVYAGEIRYKFGAVDGDQKKEANPLTCTMMATMYFDLNDGLENDSIMVDWGDGHFTVVFATSITQDTTKPVGFAGLKPLYQHVYEGQHTYDSIPPGGYCHIFVMGQYRLNYTSNVGNGLTSNVPFYIETSALMDTTPGFSNNTPDMPAPGVRFGSAQNAFSLGPVLTEPDPDGDSIVFEVVQPMQSRNVTVPEYLYPDQFCNKYNPGTSAYTMNTETGEISWDATCYQGIYSITALIKKYRDGRLMGTMMRDQNIYVGARLITGLDEPQRNAVLLIFGNPVDNTLRGSLSELSSTTAQLQIISVDGKINLQDKLSPGGNFNIDVSTLPQGIYFLYIHDSGKTYNRKFVKF